MSTPTPCPTFALLTDFGTSDWYVAAMKGVLLSRCPQAQIIDITHHIAHGDSEAGAFVLSQCADDFPAGTLFVAVVDPGVGTTRKPVAVRAQQRYYIGPDNGLFGFLNDYEARTITNALFHGNKHSHTFHGRDIFAPAAAALGSGEDFASIGPLVDALTPVSWPTVEVTKQGLHGCILVFDHFGNAITNLHREFVSEHFSLKDIHVSLHPDRLPLVNTFSDVPLHAPLAYFGSGGFLEIAVNGGSARDVLSLTKHHTVEILA